MRVSTMLLASAAAITTTAAFAADLPSRKAAPVEYVRVCSTMGEGYFYIPGTDTCIKIGGRARYEYQYGEPFARNDATTGSRTTGRIYVDTRTATEYGLLRAYVRYDISRRTGQIFSGSSLRQGVAFTGTGVDYAGQAQTEVNLDRAFIQFGGLTAGRTESFFDFYAGDLEYIGTTAGSALNNNLLAYTATFGAGFSATLSIEDHVDRRQSIADIYPTGAYRYTGDGVPDVVGNVRVEQGWGSAQLSGAIHQVRIGNYAAIGGITPNGASPDAKYGFALNAGVTFNLPFAAGDTLTFQGTYTKGAATYIASNPFGIGTTFGSGVGALGNLAFPDATFYDVGAGVGKLGLTTAWGLTAAGLHYWTPTIRQALFGSYIKVDQPGGAFIAAGAGVPGNALRDFSYWTVGTNVTWSPVKDFDIGAEVDYIYLKTSNGPVFTAIATDPVTRVFSKDSAVVGRLKIQRDF
ncbi:polymerase [Alsobacter metallidurans]|uniref:Porin n=1 Tax=Alsobacter metallidurans TaxID=340221 RepID=A0A917MIC0_9HYPH|nr:porin [Alsobacter metallidurans]GGH23241.1 polymerase [Alsobacter metallidurans]